MGDSVRFRREASSSPITRFKFWWFAGPLIATVLLMIGLGIASVHLASGAGAYIQGESLWS